MPPLPSRTWIFQANPLDYEIDRALLSLPGMTWRIKQTRYKDDTAPGHKVFLWKSGRRGAAIVAEASVLTAASMLEERRRRNAVLYSKRKGGSADRSRATCAPANRRDIQAPTSETRGGVSHPRTARSTLGTSVGGRLTWSEGAPTFQSAASLAPNELSEVPIRKYGR
jgi:hypothetical protein